jgi:hypothetical protein
MGSGRTSPGWPTLDGMLQGGLWGRPAWSWGLDVGVVLLAVLLLIFGDSPTTRLLAVLFVVWRAITVALAVLLWRRAERRRPPDGRRVP